MKTKKIYREFCSANIIGVTLEHNGIKGGDAGHGGFVRINVKDLASTSMELNGEECSEFELIIRGDTERETFISAFKMIVEELESNTKCEDVNPFQQFIDQEIQRLENKVLAEKLRNGEVSVEEYLLKYK